MHAPRRPLPHSVEELDYRAPCLFPLVLIDNRRHTALPQTLRRPVVNVDPDDPHLPREPPLLERRADTRRSAGARLRPAPCWPQADCSGCGRGKRLRRSRRWPSPRWRVSRQQANRRLRANRPFRSLRSLSTARSFLPQLPTSAIRRVILSARCPRRSWPPSGGRRRSG